MNLSSSCPGPALDFVKISDNYAQLTGLLAGFAFAALVMVLTRRREAQDESHRLPATDGRVALALASAFFALTIATLVYSVMGGEDLKIARGRAATEELIAGLPFGLATIMLFYAIASLMELTLVGRGATLLARWTASIVVPALTMFYLVNGVGDTETARALIYNNPVVVCNGSAPLPPLGIELSVALFLVMIAVVAVGAPSGPWRRLLQRLAAAAPWIVVGLSIVSAVAVGIVSTLDVDFLLSEDWVRNYLVGTFVTLLVIAVFLSTKPDETVSATGPEDLPAPRSSDIAHPHGARHSS
ncbi:MAG TPA: hypothetical protein VH561_00150 [Micromonosporaceae bacterium]